MPACLNVHRKGSSTKADMPKWHLSNLQKLLCNWSTARSSLSGDKNWTSSRSKSWPRSSGLPSDLTLKSTSFWWLGASAGPSVTVLCQHLSDEEVWITVGVTLRTTLAKCIWVITAVKCWCKRNTGSGLHRRWQETKVAWYAKRYHLDSAVQSSGTLPITLGPLEMALQTIMTTTAFRVLLLLPLLLGPTTTNNKNNSNNN